MKSEYWIDQWGHEHWGNPLSGNPHRTDGPAVIFRDGSRQWHWNGEFHRLDGPAIENCDGYKEWIVSGVTHRTDGPAVERPDGTKEWWLDGLQMTEREWRSDPRVVEFLLNQALKELANEENPPR